MDTAFGLLNIQSNLTVFIVTAQWGNNISSLKLRKLKCLVLFSDIKFAQFLREKTEIHTQAFFNLQASVFNVLNPLLTQVHLTGNMGS